MMKNCVHFKSSFLFFLLRGRIYSNSLSITRKVFFIAIRRERGSEEWMRDGSRLTMIGENWSKSFCIKLGASRRCHKCCQPKIAKSWKAFYRGKYLHRCRLLLTLSLGIELQNNKSLCKLRLFRKVFFEEERAANCCRWSGEVLKTLKQHLR